MAFFSSIYVNPKTPAHLRATFAKLQQLADGADGGLAELEAIVEFLVEQAGGYEGQFLETVPIGAPVRVTPAGFFRQADATLMTTARVAGLALDEGVTGGFGRITTDGRVSRIDWTAVTGTADLIPGSAYYLNNTPGKLTTTAPDSTNEASVYVGRALSLRELDVEIQPPIYLRPRPGYGAGSVAVTGKLWISELRNKGAGTLTGLAIAKGAGSAPEPQRGSGKMTTQAVLEGDGYRESLGSGEIVGI